MMERALTQFKILVFGKQRNFDMNSGANAGAEVGGATQNVSEMRIPLELQALKRKTVELL